MKLKTRTEKGRMGGYVGRVFCEMHDGKWLWSESTGIERVSREDARSDAQWLLSQHQKQTAAVEL